MGPGRDDLRGEGRRRGRIPRDEVSALALGGRPRDPVAEVLIVRRDPRINFRVVENQMNYAYLGKRLMSSAAENFPIFLADLCARAGQAFLPPSTRALLEHGNSADYEFPSSQAILEY